VKLIGPVRSLIWVGVLVLLLFGNWSHGEENPDYQIKWHSDIDRAWEITQESKQSLLLFVTHPDCAYCTLMKKKTFQDDGVVADVSESFVSAAVDAQIWTRFVQRLGVRIYPSTVIISHDNKVLDRIGGYVEPLILRARLEAASRRTRDARR